MEEDHLSLVEEEVAIDHLSLVVVVVVGLLLLVEEAEDLVSKEAEVEVQVCLSFSLEEVEGGHHWTCDY